MAGYTKPRDQCKKLPMRVEQLIVCICLYNPFDPQAVEGPTRCPLWLARSTGQALRLSHAAPKECG